MDKEDKFTYKNSQKLARRSDKEFPLRPPPGVLMKEFIGCLEAMLLLGISHHDAHPGNVSRSYGHPDNTHGSEYRTKFLDFGFAVPHVAKDIEDCEQW